MKRFNLMNNIFGWFSFAVAATVYLLTIEPTASFWDCGEFILSAYKLEVGHPPGAPFFMLTAKFFSLFASDPTQVAVMVNAMSGLLSAATILFLFWTITHLARKLIYTDNTKEMTTGQMIAIIGSGLVGALTYTFTDTFWFSAVEGEVYAYSSMFTALVFWLILKWENRADQPGADKWLVLIAYAMGLSIGVHLLNLLCIPAIVLVYYFKKKEDPDLKGTLLALIGSVMLIVVLMYGIIPGFTKVGGWFELLFVNSLGFSYNAGVFFYIILVVAVIAWGLYETLAAKGSLKRAKIAFVLCMALSGITLIGNSIILWILLTGGLIAFVNYYKKISFRMINTIILCLMVVLVGYSSFALIPIRSAANPPMDQNSPEHIFALGGYLNREQYGDRPLFYGNTYASTEKRDPETRALKVSSEKKEYDKVVKKSPDQKDEYVVVGTRTDYELTNTMLLPRMYSTEDRHVKGYRVWAGITNLSVAPTFLDNLRFFFDYQLNFMYFRYFMWNFSGRQNDVQGNGEMYNGNWITGIGFVDEMLGRGPQDNLPPSIAENKGHNTYYMLPLILGILGIAYQLMRGKKGEQQFLITFMLFFMTGIAIIMYLNQQPEEPRERDYAYAGSFYAFCIWIGFGVAFIWNLLKKKLPELPSAIIASVACLFVPIQMASENWDDHDRSGRYVMRDFGQNYLRGCEPNAILFTMGDNDTFPLWYAQEVEGFRTDVRVCNLSYLNTPWYVDQMRRDAYDSPALPITWEEHNYQKSNKHISLFLSRKEIENEVNNDLAASQEGKLMIGRIDFSQIYDTDVFKDTVSLDEVLDKLKNLEVYSPKNPIYTQDRLIIPSRNLKMDIDTSKVDWAALGTKPKSEFVINISENEVFAPIKDMMIMEMLANINKDDWKRPIYYALTIGEAPLNLNAHSALEGINYRILPGEVGPNRINVDVMYDNLMNKYKWGNVQDPNVYLDENCLRMCRAQKILFSELVTALLQKGDKERALKVLDKSVEVFPGNTVPRAGESVSIVTAYYELDQPEKAHAIIDEILHRADGSLKWYASMDSRSMKSATWDVSEQLAVRMQILDVYQAYDREKYEAFLAETMTYLELFLNNGVLFNQIKSRIHPLDYMMHIVRNGVFLVQEDSVAQEVEFKKVERVAGLMQKYSPELLQKYFSTQN